ncbi:HAMP domain-containing histidine kinase, partial [Chroococcidiopsidales cyanobacterium LEGE 13417]|nr:HAMP domain-containing histidine kinase [Chroococcidiopsidales cyanobacterium LEGE 13417]
RLACWYAGVISCILGLSSLGVYQVVAHAYRESIDEGLESVAETLDRSLEPVLQESGSLQHVARHLSLKLCAERVNCFIQTTATNPKTVEPVNYYMRLLDRQGKLLALGGLQLDQTPRTIHIENWQTLINSIGTRYRQIEQPLYLKKNLWGYLQVGRSLSDLDRHLTVLRLILLIGWLATVLLVVWSSWWLAGLAMQPVYRSYQQMQQFTADAAHEFRTPLATIQSTVEAILTLHGQLEGSEIGDKLAVLKRQSKRLSKLVGDLLLLARIEGRLVGQFSSCCLNDLLSDIIEELAFVAVEANVTLVMPARPQKPLYVKGNEEQLYRMISNLIVNAIQATPIGGKVALFLTCNEREALIQIQDTGVGIAPEEQIQIFNRFYRVQQDRSRRTGGSGLGLPIAAAIAQIHRGSISVQSQLGQGSTFTARLPLEN